MKTKTTKLCLQAAKTLTGIPAARNKPQRPRVDAFGRVKPIGQYHLDAFQVAFERGDGRGR